MPKITFISYNILVEIPNGAPLLEAARNAGVHVETPCGGKGSCGKCLVRIVSGAVDCEAGGDRGDGRVLLCRTAVKDEPVCVQLLRDLKNERGRFGSPEELSPYIPADFSPLVRSALIKVPEPASMDGFSDLDRFERAAREALSCAGVKIPIPALAKLPEKLRENGGQVQFLYWADGAGVVNVVDFCGDAGVGLAVDIGTTTVAALLVDMKTGAALSSKTAYNAQIECGLDVISRINYARKYLQELRDRVLKTINGLLNDMCADAGILNLSVCHASVSGNTTMIHLLLGIPPEHIRLSPYTPAILGVPAYRAADIGIDIHPETPAFIAPAVGSYVGGDITAGALCTALAAADGEDAADETVLFIDIGTNGELLLGNGEFVFGCACSAGPAFEGGGIKHGMRASDGAIEKAVIDGKTGVAELVTIGGAQPAGICGSGVISLTAELLRSGIIDSAGKFADRGLPNVEKSGRSAEYVICKGDDEGQARISLSEADIDNLIRAKAAIFSACQTMLDSVGMTFDDIARIYVAGGFGSYLNMDDAQTIGLLPAQPREKFIFLGNASLIGAWQTLLSAERRDKIMELSSRITYIDLSNEPGYMDRFMAALFLPHTDRSLFQK